VEESLSSSSSSAAPAPVQAAPAEKPKKKTTPKSDEPHDEDAPSPSDAAAAPDATETRTELGAGEDFGSSLVKAQKHVRNPRNNTSLESFQGARSSPLRTHSACSSPFSPTLLARNAHHSIVCIIPTVPRALLP
jgi:hypothetical protein